MSMTFAVNDSPLCGRVCELIPACSLAHDPPHAAAPSQEGSKMTSSMIKERLEREAEENVSIRVAAAAASAGMPGTRSVLILPRKHCALPQRRSFADAVEVQGRGELQMAILIENMRREGFELAVSPPRVLFKTVSGSCSYALSRPV